MADNTDKVEGQRRRPVLRGHQLHRLRPVPPDGARTTSSATRTRATPTSHKQPENDEEDQACQDAMEECPVEAIGDDG